jgi:hypothetical protein
MVPIAAKFREKRPASCVYPVKNLSIAGGRSASDDHRTVALGKGAVSFQLVRSVPVGPPRA